MDGTNYFSWNVALWLSNDGGIYRHALDIVQHARRGIDADDGLKAFVEEMNPIAGDASMFTDILGYALAFVNWRAVSESLADEDDLARWEEARKA